MRSAASDLEISRVQKEARNRLPFDVFRPYFDIPQLLLISISLDLVYPLLQCLVAIIFNQLFDVVRDDVILFLSFCLVECHPFEKGMATLRQGVEGLVFGFLFVVVAALDLVDHVLEVFEVVRVLGQVLPVVYTLTIALFIILQVIQLDLAI